MTEKNGEKSGLFRQRALSQVASPEQWDQPERIIGPSGWLLLLALLFIVGGTLFWAFTGSLSDGIKVTGIVFPASGVKGVYAYTTGFISEVTTKEGEYADTNQILLVAPNEGVLEKLEAIKKERDALSRVMDGERPAGQDYEGDSGYERDLAYLQQETDALLEEYEKTSIIRAPVSGTVQYIASVNGMVEPGQKVASLIQEDKLTNSREVIAYVPLAVAKKILPGMEAQVSPSYAPREEYGFMRGYVSRVSSVAVTEAYIEKTFGDASYASMLLPGESAVEVRIMLNMDPNSRNSFVWSGKKGQELTVEVSTLCSIQIITRTRRPVELLLGAGLN